MSPELGAASTACIGLLVVETSSYFVSKSVLLQLIVYTTLIEHPYGRVKWVTMLQGSSYTSSPFKERHGFDLSNPTTDTNG